MVAQIASPVQETAEKSREMTVYELNLKNLGRRIADRMAVLSPSDKTTPAYCQSEPLQANTRADVCENKYQDSVYTRLLVSTKNIDHDDREDHELKKINITHESHDLHDQQAKEKLLSAPATSKSRRNEEHWAFRKKLTDDSLIQKACGSKEQGGWELGFGFVFKFASSHGPHMVKSSISKVFKRPDNSFRGSEPLYVQKRKMVIDEIRDLAREIDEKRLREKGIYQNV